MTTLKDQLPRPDQVFLNEKIYSLFSVLLKNSKPNQWKKNQLARLLKLENGGVDRASWFQRIEEFYGLPFQKRTSGKFSAIFQVKPYPWLLSEFYLNFRNAEVSERQNYETAQSIHHLIHNTIEIPSEIGELKLFHIITYSLSHPRWDQGNGIPDFMSFIWVWEKMAFQRFGSKYANFFSQLKSGEEILPFSLSGGPMDTPPVEKTDRTISITQSEIDWIKEIYASLTLELDAPPYPLAKGPQNRPMRILENLVREYNLQFKKPQSGQKAMKRKALLKKTLLTAGEKIISKLAA